MGVNYTAKVIVGVPVTKGDFVETREVLHVACDHPTALGKKFCPECGVPTVARKNICERDFPRPAFASDPFFGGFDSENGEDASWFEEMTSGHMQVGGLALVNLNDYENPTKAFVLGTEAMRSGETRGYSSRETMRGSELAGLIHKMQNKMLALGIRDREVQVFCILRCA